MGITTLVIATSSQRFSHRKSSSYERKGQYKVCEDKDGFCNTIVTVALIETSIQRD